MNCRIVMSWMAAPLAAGLVLTAVSGVGAAQPDSDVLARLSDDLNNPALFCKGSNGGLVRSAALIVMADEIKRDRIQIADAAAGAVDVEDNLDLFEKLGLMEGHLLIGKALLDEGMQRDAMPHFGHPVRELYDYLKPVFSVRKFPEFGDDLADLERRAATAPKDPGTTAACNNVIAKIAGLRRTIPAGLLESEPFMIRALALMMQDAAGDLGESLDKGRIVNTVEYHDAMGFARYADSIARAWSGKLGPQAAVVAEEMTVVLAAFPSLRPPARPARSVADVEGAAGRVRALVR